MVPRCAAEIIECWRNGLESLILVVGNDDDMSGITLVPVEDMLKLLNELDSNGHLNRDPLPPSIKVMTPQRAPLQSFSIFSELPKEIQDCIWNYAIQVPRIVELED
jgi:hypothetical protein